MTLPAHRENPLTPQNSYVERFNGSYRRGVLDAYLFRTLGEARDITAAWLADYNEGQAA